MEKLKQHKKVVVISAAILVVAGALLWGKFGYSGGQSKLPYTFVKTAQAEFVRQISLTGAVKAASDIQLSFARPGKVAKVSVKAGDKVKAGQVIAELEKNNISADYLSAVAQWQAGRAQVVQAQANLDAQRSKKQDLLNGAKSEDVAVSQTQADSAAKGLADAQTALNNMQAQSAAILNTLYAQIDNTLADSYNQANDVVYHITDGMFSNSISADPKLAFSAALNSQSEYAAESGRLAAMSAVKKLDTDRQSLNGDYANYAAIFSQVETDLAAVQNYLASLNSALNYSTPSNSFNQAAINGGKTAVNGAIAEINGSVSALDALKQSVDLQMKVNQNSVFAAQAAVNQAQNAVKLAQSQLALKKSGSTAEALAVQDDAIKQAEGLLSGAQSQQTAGAASIDKVKAEMADATIAAPIDGVITSVNLDPGEAVNANVPVIGLQSAGKFQVETYLPEIYVGEVKAGDAAKITFDAFGQDRVFGAKVISIDPAAQLKGGILAYRTLLEFVEQDAEIKTGLTANIKITVADDKDALSVPESSVIKAQDKSYVILADGQKQEVTAGKTSGTGWIEILSGLKAGDLVADFGTLGAKK